MDVHDKKQEAIICPVLGEEIPNRRKWCANIYLTEENGRLKYVCSNVSCDECYEAVIN